MMDRKEKLKEIQETVKENDLKEFTNEVKSIAQMYKQMIESCSEPCSCKKYKHNKGDEWIEIEYEDGDICLINAKKISRIWKNKKSIEIYYSENESLTVNRSDPSYPALYKRFFGEGEIK
jgi:predicted ribosome-associated RNA-binding protein Tma20